MNSSRGKRPTDERINAAPGDDVPVPRPPQNVTDTDAWKSSQRSVNRMWSNYREHLARAFSRMTRAEQESLVQRLCVIVTLGVTGLALLLFYPVIPRLGRVFGVPAALFGAYWAGNRMVTLVVLQRLANLLNDDNAPSNSSDSSFVIRGPQDR